MAIQYDRKYDILWLILREVPIRGGRTIDDVTHIDLDESGDICGMILESVAGGVDLQRVPRAVRSNVRRMLHDGGFSIKLGLDSSAYATC